MSSEEVIGNFANEENIKVVQELTRHPSIRFKLEIYSQVQIITKRQAQRSEGRLRMGRKKLSQVGFPTYQPTPTWCAVALWHFCGKYPLGQNKSSPSVTQISIGPDQSQLGHETIPVVIAFRSISARFETHSHFGKICTGSECFFSLGFEICTLIYDWRFHWQN
jgi:hypothetical protein